MFLDEVLGQTIPTSSMSNFLSKSLVQLIYKNLQCFNISEAELFCVPVGLKAKDELP
jgi:hypothetical protein